MLVEFAVSGDRLSGESWAERWEGPDQGLIVAWHAGRAKAKNDPLLASKALAGELPVLPFKGGMAKKIKAKKKTGSLLYAAMWQGLRGEDLRLDTGTDLLLTCSKTLMPVIFTMDVSRLSSADALDNGE